VAKEELDGNGLNPQQEKFCQAYVLYRNASEAAKAAGYSERSAYNQGSRLLKSPKIQERIENLEKEMETNIDVISEIEAQYKYAKDNNNTGSALKALELLSRAKGKDDDEEAPKTVKELEAEIIRSLEILGEPRASALFLACSWFASPPEEEAQEEEEEEQGEEDEDEEDDAPQVEEELEEEED
jgi:phage terminase small subunit